ncbi:MAG: hypothetical protein LBS93_04980, partial [Synergistaceae bacterium]|nr:hypothetical protein [Synergistaceae bacterium]
MAIQTAYPPAGDFLKTPSAQVRAGAARSSSSSGAGRERFNKLLGTMTESRPALAAKYREMGEEIERFADELSDEELAMLVGPLSNGADSMRDFADAIDAELSEGDVRGALDLAQEAVEKIGRFDPDVILGEDFAGGSLHRLIEEFLKKYSGLANPLGGDEPGGQAEMSADIAELPGAGLLSEEDDILNASDVSNVL